MQELSSRSPLWTKASALAIALPLVALAGCSSEVPGRETTEEADGSIRGELEALVATFDDGTAANEYFLRIGGSETDERKLIFDRDPNLPSGAQLKVWGEEVDGEIRVSKYELTRRLGSASQALIGAPKYRDRTIAWVFVDIGGGAGMLTNAEAERRLFGMNTMPADKSLKQYYLEASYGMQDITGSVVAPLRYPMSTCDTRGMTTALRSQVQGTFDHYLWYFTTRTSACSWSGLASVGTPDRASRDTWYNGSSSCVVLVQEPGHNFGMQHSSSLRCANGVFADNPNATSNNQPICTHGEYGDRYDPMGGGCYHMNAWQKAYQGWFGGCNSVKVTTSGTYSLLPIEPQCDGVQVLQIPMPKDRSYTYPPGGGGNGGTVTLRYYYLELRTNQGMFDSALQNTPFVLVHVADDYQTRTERGQHTWILDMNPATTGTNSFDGLRAGGTFTDPAGGTSFTVEQISQSGATIRVEIAPGTPGAGTPSVCMDGTPLQGTGPTNCNGTGSMDGGVAGSGGMAGTAGTAGMAGMAGMAGTGGDSGSAGTGGDSGSAGTGGSGDSGSTGTGATGGTDGTGGTGAPGGNGGAAGTGAPSSGGAAGTRDLDPGNPQLGLDNDAGCACRTTPEPRSGSLLWLLGLGLFGLIRRRR